MGSPDYYRRRAAELRQVADAVSIDSIKDEYRKIAAQYEAASASRSSLAEEARTFAETTTNTETQATMCRIAESYDRLIAMKGKPRVYASARPAASA